MDTVQAETMYDPGIPLMTSPPIEHGIGFCDGRTKDTKKIDVWIFFPTYPAP